MRSKDQELANHMKDCRLRKGLSQAEAARQAGVTPAWLCQVETGVRPPSRLLAETLEQVYGTRRGHFVKMYGFPSKGRRHMDSDTAAALAAIRGSVSLDRSVPRRGRPVKIKHGWKDWRGTLDDALSSATIALDRDLRQDLEMLESVQNKDEFWKLMNGMQFDSATEKRFLVKLGLAGAEFVRVAPSRFGVSAWLVDVRGEDVRRTAQPAMVLEEKGLAVAVWPQRAVHASRLWKLDALVVAAWKGRRLTIDLEFGDDDSEQDARRQQELGLPVLRYEVDAVKAKGFVARLLRDVKKLVLTHSD